MNKKTKFLSLQETENEIKILIIFIILFFSIVILFNSCTQQKTGWQGTIEEIDGVTIVKNPEEPLYGEFTLELLEDLSIGNEGDENYIFIRPGVIRVGIDDTIYVSDYGFFNVRCFDKNGRYLRAIGRKGQGPGELGAFTFNLSYDDKIYFADAVNARISILDLNGRFINNFKNLNLNVGYWALFSDKDNNIYFSREFRSEKDSHKITIHRYNPFGKELLNYGEFLGDPIIYYERNGKRRPLRSSSTPITVWVVTKDGRLYAGYSGEYQIIVYAPDGNLSLKFGREYDPIPDTDNWLAGTSDYLPAFFRIWLLDDDENLWIELFRKKGQKERVYDVFSSDGKYLKQIHSEHRLFCIKDKKAYSVVHSEEGVPLVKRFIMIENQSKD